MQVPLASFLGLYTEADPTNLPEGVSPLTWDTDFLIGSVRMRPGLQSAYSFQGNVTGPNNCASGSDVSLGFVPWTNPGNITSLNAQYATVTPQASGSPAAYCGTAAVGSGVWTNPTNAQGAPDGNVATANLVTNKFGQLVGGGVLNLTNFGLSSQFTIQGVLITVTGSQSGNLNAPAVQLQLLSNGIPIGSTKSAVLPPSLGNVTFGGSADLWDAALAAALVNSATFGVSILTIASNSPASRSETFNVDAVQIQVFWSVNASDELLAKTFNFNVPNQPIQGISIGVTGHQTGSGTLTAQLTNGAGTLVGNAKTFSLTAGDTRVILGSGTDNWGAGLLFSDVNNNAWGVVITASGGGTFSIDLVDATISQTAGTLNYNWVKTYATRNGNVATLALDSSGVLKSENVTSNPGILNTIFTGIFTGSFVRSITLDDVEYMAMSDLNNGFDIPRQWNGTNLRRVSMVGPGAAPSVAFTSNGVTLTAVTQAASFALPVVQNGTWALWSVSPNGSAPGNLLTLIFPSTFTLPSGFVNGAYVVLAGFPTMNGFNPNSGASNGGIANPAAYQIFNVGGPIQGQSAYTGFSVLLLQSGFFSQRISGGGATLQLSQATATAASQVPNVQVGSQFIIAGVTPAGWNGTWTCQGTPNAAQLSITNTVLASNTATYSYNVITGTDPTAGQTVIITGCVNGNGIFNGTFTIANVNAGLKQFTVTIASPNIGSSAETGSAIVNGTIFLFEPQKIVGNATVFGTIATTGAIGAGSRACVVMFLTDTGFISPPSPYLQFSTTGSASALVVSNIPTGPANVIARIVAFTGAQVTQVPGQIGNFFWIPEPVTVFDPTAGQNVTYSATIINDNTTTQATFTFTDAVLLAAQAIDIQGNNLFNQAELGPALGCIAYAGRMHYWGVLNKVPNFINMSFDGGAGINSGVGSGGTAGSTTYPLGWTPSDTFGIIQPSAVSGTSYYVKQTGATTPIGMIVQKASVDQYGVNILNPQTAYSVRIVARSPASSTVGQVVVDLFSPSFNKTYGTATFQLSAMTSSFQQFTSTLLTTIFQTAVPNDLQLRVYMTNMTVNEDVELDRLEVYPTFQPVLSTQILSSYAQNFEAFDQVTGVMDTSIQNQQPVRSAFTLNDTLYPVKTGCFLSVQDNGVTEPNGWTIRMVSNSVGTPSVNGVDFVDNQNQGESWAIIAGRTGVYIFTGGEPICISGEIRTLWNLVNWTAGQTLWVRNDQTNRRILVGVPLPTPNQFLPNAPTNSNPTTPNVILAMSYRELNHPAELADRSAVRTSFTGKLIAPEIARKWTIWQIQAPYADFVQRQNNTTPLFLGNSKGTGKVYQLTEGRTDDDGAIINELYTTYGWIKPDLEQALQLGSVRKYFGYLTMIVDGSGSMAITAYPDKLTTKYPATLFPVTLPNPGGFDLEYGSIDQEGSRVFLQFSVNALGANFELSRLMLAIGKPSATAVRGV